MGTKAERRQRAKVKRAKYHLELTNRVQAQVKEWFQNSGETAIPSPVFEKIANVELGQMLKANPQESSLIKEAAKEFEKGVLETLKEIT